MAVFAALDAEGGCVVVQPYTETRIAIIARDFAKLTPAERDQTLMLDPTREGRQRLSDAIRVKLLSVGQLGDTAITARVLEPRGLGVTCSPETPPV